MRARACVCVTRGGQREREEGNTFAGIRGLRRAPARSQILLLVPSPPRPRSTAVFLPPRSRRSVTRSPLLLVVATTRALLERRVFTRDLSL